jgi:DNA-directed RNA polymerase subunit beta
VRVGARVRSGDILCGKITPKGETELSPEEKLLTAIFGEKAKDVKDSSLRMSPGMIGTVIDVKIFSRRIDDPLLEREHGARIGQLRKEEREEIARIIEARDEELRGLLTRPRNQTIALCLKKGTVEPFLEEGTKVSAALLRKVRLAEVDLTTLKVHNTAVNEKIRSLIDEARRRIERVRDRTEEQIDKIFQPDELPPGVVQLVKVYIAEKRKISVGDKMAGRHGNKGIIARIAPQEDMPYLPDGSSVDIVLNPLGVPSRMNVGQILETHLGWAADVLGFEAKTPVFQGASEDEIAVLLKLAGLKWVASSLNAGLRWPLESADYRRLLEEVRSRAGVGRIESAGGGPNGDGDPADIGIGKSLDEYLGDSAGPEALEVLRGIGDFVVRVGRSVAGKRKRRLGEMFPAVAALAEGELAGGGLEEAVRELLSAGEILPNGKVWLRDGRSGERFRFPITVGVIYMLKLSHLVDDKIHARSIGPYSLITQQPLGGKAQFGGQRFGEMEVWALEAYGAAYTLQEMLTVKSDDVHGRVKTYEAIVKGEEVLQPGIPESFKVLVKELQSLALAVEVLNENEEEIRFPEEGETEGLPDLGGINLQGREHHE